MMLNGRHVKEKWLNREPRSYVCSPTDLSVQQEAVQVQILRNMLQFLAYI